ncbi:MAG: endonuclease domain-containing protein [Flavobacteriales bacterium]|nr:endonuclease domain-containing protein [Flavobacteriales bacterium]
MKPPTNVNLPENDNLINQIDAPQQLLTTIDGIPVRRNFVVHLPYNPHLKKFLKSKRKARILPEVLFWKEVRNNKFYGIDFDRQRIIGNYIVDFYVKALGLVIEIDGTSHDDKEEYDAERQQFLEGLGLKVFRIPNSDMMNDRERVMADLKGFVLECFSV